MPVFAEGRVEHQKQNQTATSQWPVCFVFGVQLDYSCRLKRVPSDAEKVVQHTWYDQISLSFYSPRSLLVPVSAEGRVEYEKLTTVLCLKFWY